MNTDYSDLINPAHAFLVSVRLLLREEEARIYDLRFHRDSDPISISIRRLQS